MEIQSLFVHVAGKKEVEQIYVAVQAVKASVTVAKTARYQTGTRISSCANLSQLSTRKINCYILTL